MWHTRARTLKLSAEDAVGSIVRVVSIDLSRRPEKFTGGLARCPPVRAIAITEKEERKRKISPSRAKDSKNPFAKKLLFRRILSLSLSLSCSLLLSSPSVSRSLSTHARTYMHVRHARNIVYSRIISYSLTWCSIIALCNLCCTATISFCKPLDISMLPGRWSTRGPRPRESATARDDGQPRDVYYPKSARRTQAGANEDAARDSLSSPNGESTPTTCDERQTVAARRVPSRSSRPLRTSAVSSLRSCAEPSEIALRERATSVCVCVYVCVRAYARVSLPRSARSFLPSSSVSSSLSRARLAQAQIHRCSSRATHQDFLRTSRSRATSASRTSKKKCIPRSSSATTATMRTFYAAIGTLRLALAQTRTAVPSLSRAGALLVLSPCCSLLLPALSRSAPFVNRGNDDGVFPAPSTRDSVQLATNISRSPSFSFSLFLSLFRSLFLSSFRQPFLDQDKLLRMNLPSSKRSHDEKRWHTGNDSDRLVLVSPRCVAIGWRECGVNNMAY